MVAGDEVLRGEHHIDAAAGLDSEAVGKHLRGGESPARTAAGLVTDGVDVLGPLLTGVKRGGDIVHVDVIVGADGHVNALRVDHPGTEKTAGLIPGPALEVLVPSSPPGGHVGVDLVDHLIRDDGLGGVAHKRDGRSDAQARSNNHKFEHCGEWRYRGPRTLR